MQAATMTTDAATEWAREQKAIWTSADKTLRHPDGRFVRAETLEEAVTRMRTHVHSVL